MQSVPVSIVPSADNAHDLGSSSYRWKDLWLAGNLYFASGVEFLQRGIYAYKIKHSEGSHPTEIHDFLYRFIFKYLDNIQTGAILNNLSHSFNDEYYTGIYTVMIYIASDGYYDFGVNSDDASAVFVDGVLATAWLSGHGVLANWYKTSFNSVCSGLCDVDGDGANEPCHRTTLHPNGIYLNKGWHLIVAIFEEVGGGDVIHVYMRPHRDEDPSTAGGTSADWALIGEDSVSAGYILDYRAVPLGLALWMLRQTWNTILIPNPERNELVTFGTLNMAENDIINVKDFIKFTGGTDKILAIQGESGCKLYIENLDKLGAFRFDIPNDIFYSRHTYPLSDNAYDLGSPSYRWRDGWFASGLAVGDITSRADKLHVKSSPWTGILVESTGDVPAITLKGYDGTNYYSTKLVGAYHGRSIEWHHPVSGGYFMFVAPSATSDNPLQNCWRLWFRCRYWDGSASKYFDIQIIPEVLDTSPTGRLRFWMSVAGDVLTLHSSTGIISHKNVIPSTDNAFDLGSSSYAWKDAWVKGILYLQGSKDSGSAVIADIQDPTNRYLELHTPKGSWVFNYHPSGYAPYFAVYDEVNDVYKLKVYGDRIELITLRPLSDNAYDLGSSSYRWARIYVRPSQAGSDNGLIMTEHGAHVISTPSGLDRLEFYRETDGRWGIFNRTQSKWLWYVLQEGQTIMRTVFPIANNAHDLGSSTNAWRRIFGYIHRLVPTSPPSSPFEGDLIYDSSTKSLKVYNGSEWLELLTSPVKVLISSDDTRVNAGTTESEVKYFRFAKTSETPYKTIFVVASLWVDSGTGYLRIYVDNESSPRLELSTTSTTEALLTGSFDVSDLAEGIHTIHIKIVNSGGNVVYNELVEVWGVV